MYREIREYDCGWCGTVFRKVAQKSNGATNWPQSNSIECPGCSNFVKTWADGKTIEVLKEKNESN